MELRKDSGRGEMPPLALQASQMPKSPKTANGRKQMGMEMSNFTMLSELRARLAMGDAEHLGSAPHQTVMAKRASPVHPSAWGPDFQIPLIPAFPSWPTMDWQDNAARFLQPDDGASAAHSRTNEAHRTYGDTPQSRELPLEMGTSLDFSSDPFGPEDRNPGFFRAHEQTPSTLLTDGQRQQETGSKPARQQKDLLSSGLFMEPEASTGSLASFEEARENQDSLGMSSLAFVPQSPPNQRSGAGKQGSTTLPFTRLKGLSGVLEPDHRVPFPGDAPSRIQHLACKDSSSAPKAAGLLGGRKQRQTGGKEPNFLDLLRANSSTDKSLDACLPNHNPQIRQLGSGKIAIDLAKSVNQASWEPSLPGKLQSKDRSCNFMPAANFGTGSLALQIAQGNKACLRSSGSGEVSIKSSSGQKEVPASPEISRGSHAGHSGQNAEGRQTRSKTSQRGSVSPMTTPKSGLSILPLSDASASLNSASLEPQNLARSPSPVSQPIQIPSPDPQCILGLSIEPSRAEEKRDAPHAEGEGPAQQNPLAASTYLTRIPDCLFPSLLEEREPTEQMTQAGNDTEKDLEPLLWTEPDLLTASTDKVLPDIDTESLAAADVQVQEAEVRADQEADEPGGNLEDLSPTLEPGRKRANWKRSIPISGFAAEDAPGWRPPPSPPHSDNSPPQSGSSGGRDDSGGSRFWTVHSLNSWAHGDRGHQLHSKSSIQSLPSFRSWAGSRLPAASANGGDDTAAAIRWRRAVHLRRWSSRAKSPSRAVRLAKAKALRSVQSNQEKATRYSPHHSHSSNEGSKHLLRPSKRQAIQPLRLRGMPESNDLKPNSHDLRKSPDILQDSYGKASDNSVGFHSNLKGQKLSAALNDSGNLSDALDEPCHLRSDESKADFEKPN